MACFLLDFFDCFDSFDVLDDFVVAGVGDFGGIVNFDDCFELFFAELVGPFVDCWSTAGA